MPPRSKWKEQLDKALRAEGRKRSKSAMQRVAELFYKDPQAAVSLTQYLLPKMRAIDAKVTTDGPFRLIIEVAPNTRKDEQDKQDPITLEYANAKAQQAKAQAQVDRFKMNKQDHSRQHKCKLKRKTKRTNKKENK